MHLSNLSQRLRSANLDNIVFPIGTVIPYAGNTPSIFGWVRWNIADNGFCLFATEDNLGTQTAATGGASYSATLTSTGAHSRTVAGTFQSVISADQSIASISDSTLPWGEHSHTISSSTTSLSPRKILYNFLVSTSPRATLPPNSLVFGDRFVSFGSEINQTLLTYISGQNNGTGSINSGSSTQTLIGTSSSAGTHSHQSQFARFRFSGSFGATAFDAQTAGAHTHTVNTDYSQTIFGPTVILRLFQTLGELPPTEDVIVGFTGDLSRIKDPWYICDGTNGTLDLREKFIGIDSSKAAGDILLSDLTRNGNISPSVSSSPGHTHQGGQYQNTLNYQNQGHTTWPWSHTHSTTSISYSDTPHTAPRANLCFIQYKTESSFSISPNLISVNEGDTVTFTVSSLNVANGTTVYWTTSGTVDANDFTDNLVNGSVIINNGSATITRTLKNDFTTEGDENFRLELRVGSTSGNVVALSSLVTVIDTSVETYSVVPNTTSVNEGSSVAFTVTTQGVPNGTTLFWSTDPVSGTVDASDFTDSTTTGSVTINNNTGTIVRGIRADAVTEGTESFRLQIRTGSVSGVVVATSSLVTINDTSLTPTYAVTPNITSVNEGSSVTFTVTTTDVANGTTLFWSTQQISGTVNASDFTDNAVTGSFTINNNTATIVRGISADFTTEGTESFALQIRTGSTSGTVVATSSTVTINDTSVPTYAVTPNVTSVNEGSSVTFTVTTQGVPNGTVLFWSTDPTSGTVNASDFTDNQTTGSFTINNNTATIVRGIRADAVTEGTEQFRLRIRTGSVSGVIVATSSIVSIIDTSQNPTYAVTPNVTSVNEGSSVTFTVTTTDVANGTTLFWSTQSISGNIETNDFTDFVLTGSVIVNNNTATIVRGIRADLHTEGTEQFRLRLHTGSINGTVVATSSTVTINDTSRTTVVPNVTSVNEGSSVTFTVTTTDAANGTVLFWTTEAISGTVNASDFTDSTTTGSVTINNNTATIVRGIRADNFTEGTEQFRLQIRTGSTSGFIVATSAIVTINDTSLSPPPTLLSWGFNGSRQLGTGDNITRSSPTSVVGEITDWIQISGGNAHSLAIRSDGSMWSWGSSSGGQLGDGSSGFSSFRSSPGPVAIGGNNWIKVSASLREHSLALRSDGTVWAWGLNGWGELGIGSYQQRTTPAREGRSFTNWIDISAGGLHSLALRGDGRIWAWGNNGSGSLGTNESFLNIRTLPAQVATTITDWTKISAGYSHNLALRSNGTIWSWGRAAEGQLGTGNTINRSSPVSITGGISNWTEISAGRYHSLAIRANGTLWAWGDNRVGQLGNFSTINRSSPVQAGSTYSNEFGWAQVSAGSFHSLALRNDGTVWAWGNNADGRLGVSTALGNSVIGPFQVVGGITTWTQISAGGGHNLAIRST